MILTAKSKVFAENHIEVLLCPPQIPHELDLDWTRTSATRGRRLTAWTRARSLQCAVCLHPPLSYCLLVPNILVWTLFTSSSGRKTSSLKPIQINTSFGVPNKKRCFLFCWPLYDYRTFLLCVLRARFQVLACIHVILRFIRGSHNSSR